MTRTGLSLRRKDAKAAKNREAPEFSPSLAFPPRVLYSGRGLKSARDTVYLTLGSAFGLGLSPIAPGSFGALLGVLAHVLIVLFLPPGSQTVAIVVVFIVVCAVHFALTPWAQAYWKCSDPRHFVLDEVAGYLLVAALFHHGQLWQIALWGFLLFRIFDIIKIPPARQIDQRMHGALGVVLDDLVSAVYAVIALHIFRWVGPIAGIDQWLISE